MSRLREEQSAQHIDVATKVVIPPVVSMAVA
jgi:hypothetical protein